MARSMRRLSTPTAASRLPPTSRSRSPRSCQRSRHLPGSPVSVDAFVQHSALWRRTASDSEEMLVEPGGLDLDLLAEAGVEAGVQPRAISAVHTGEPGRWRESRAALTSASDSDGSTRCRAHSSGERWMST